MRLRNRAVLVSMAVVLTLFLGLLPGCRKERPGFERNLPPETFLSSVPVDSTFVFYRVKLYWGGLDPDGQVVGYCLGFDHYAFYTNGRTSFIEEIMVREDFRKHGVGKELIRCFEQWSISRGSKLVGLVTRRAAPFYEAIGYESSGTFFRRLL